MLTVFKNNFSFLEFVSLQSKFGSVFSEYNYYFLNCLLRIWAED